ncbi:MAG: hypothetical protein IPI67_15065 [Myxococcales bacterium]|nr:hypothetical protein [Myxococcales bacterium]
MNATFLRRDALVAAVGERLEHVIELLPLAFRFARGSRLRLCLGAADVDHFTTPGPARVTWRIERGGSRLLLPVL